MSVPDTEAVRERVADARAHLKADPATIVKAIAWPIAIMTMVQRLVVLVPNRARTDDFTTVYRAAVRFLNHQPVYVENYITVDPHYLYPPSGTLLMAPFGVFNPDLARDIFVGLSTIALLIALYVMIRMFGFGLGSAVAPVVLFVAFTSEAVTDTLLFTNFNCFIFLAEVVTMSLLLRRQALWAGIPLGLSLAVKPLLAVLFVPILLKREWWKSILSSAVVVIVLMAAGMGLADDPGSFWKRTLPYLSEGRDYYNSSIVGNAGYFGLPDYLAWGMRIVLGLMTVGSLYLLWRYYRRENELLWLTTSTGLLLTAYFLLGPLGQGYYSMLMFPMLMTVVYRASVMGTWPVWLAVYGFLSYDQWASQKWLAFGRSAAFIKCTLGWSLLLIVPFCVLLYRYLDARAEDRLDEGIDRPLAPSAASG
ncbi:glycosyltransferase family 87 protein [Tsukamurella sp. 8F]|uniref:glycosyltransferase family 87 protein n=1 Tax=unclassified Tsukamurella TaxID=2633480 RepID=UPI0023B8C809|nr:MULTISPECIES: glycosyltransferase family 87 protein [unclassified Tsukamurella]MDF0531417.1 glycosyltransferase family 87 protein [Tsukamurella sp. 8J]MDF0585277.1 glycosyltransferase family 87 protein [Tsukamurella sp. 8F]